MLYGQLADSQVLGEVRARASAQWGKMAMVMMVKLIL
jgi:hypothetical protein